MLKLFSGASLQALLFSGVIGAVVSAWPVSSTFWARGYAKASEGREQTDKRFFDRESVMIYEIGSCRQAQHGIIKMFENFETVSAETKAENLAALAREKKRTEQALDWAADALKELDRVENEWKGQLVPPDAVRPFCLRFGQTGCQAAPPSADRARDLALRGSGGDAGNIRSGGGVHEAADPLPAGGSGDPPQ